jgi:hypothetical protein
MNVLQSHPGKGPSTGPRGLKAAVLASFLGSAREVAHQFQSHSQADWQAILIWLDISGMALYLLDRVRELNIEDSLPDSIRERLQLNLTRNRERTAALLSEAKIVADRFNQAALPFALMTAQPGCPSFRAHEGNHAYAGLGTRASAAMADRSRLSDCGVRCDDRG